MRGFAGMQTAVTVSDCPAPACSHCGGTGEEPKPGRELVRLTIEMRTVSELNAREHHWAKAKRRAKEKSTVLAHLRALGTGDGYELPLVIVLRRLSPSTHKADSDNLASSQKSVRDAVATWLGLDDGSEQIAWLYEQGKSANRKCAVEIVIREGRRA